MTGLRVLVALDPGVSRQLSLRAAAGLGGAGGVEVTGLFVEDATLLQVARLSVAREVTAEAVARALGEESVERQFRAQAERLRGLLAFEAARAGLPWRFTTARGDPVEELLRAAAEMDIVVLSHARQAALRAMAARLPIARLLGTGPRSLLVVQETWPTGRRVLALATGPSGGAVLAAAGAIAGAERLAVCAVGLAGAEPPVAHRAAPARRAIPGIDAGALLRVARSEEARVIVLGAATVEAQPGLVPELLAQGEFSLAIVR